LEPFGAIYSSPLSRARDTAEALEEAGPGPARLWPALQEIDCGSLDGAPIPQVRTCFPKLWEANLRQTDENFRWPGGESYRELRYRCLRTVRILARAHRGERIALVTHAGVVSQVLGFLAGLSPACWGAFRPGTTGITELAWDRCGGTLLTFDDRAHLPAGWC
jgi:alpha-ribazole phosphatase/probable phosphoglycerate mutase